MDPSNVTWNLVLVPVASIGCGKTTIASGLSKLFGWGHIQNDDIPGEAFRRKRFAMAIKHGLVNHGVVIADRTNHKAEERKCLMEDIAAAVPDVRFAALHFTHEPKDELLDCIREITRNRVFSRGENHQTLRTGEKSRDEVIDIMEGFLHRFEAVGKDESDSRFDLVIELSVTSSSRQNLERAVVALNSFYPRLIEGRMPSNMDLDNAIRC